MGRKKGCINKACVTNQKKITYKETEEYCSKCGNKLYYVCKECYTQMPEVGGKCCVRCIAEKKDRNHAYKKNGSIFSGVAVAVIGAGKLAIKVILKG